ncbi:MAG: immunity 53 family protein [Candidatus Omnitrophica bacterium]|nr:immunity 53 family protein [Candidatus Omnitrophota bacterium]MBU2043615.1 immunity 53 family protein [Candidatus Omnitrophota bacterium]MBU2265677.1 immunity 53 family protein [Candidatus Omnitrophota bacterium]
MEELKKLQKWYEDQCNGDWEHQYGVSINTLDNPGWTVMIDLNDTPLNNKQFETVAEGVGEKSIPESNNWIECKIENNQFVGVGGPDKLERIIEIFLNWANNTNL